ncbi:MAG: electron transfer flavoprotein subunit beta/FixA family protein [Thermodesulfobacteriota bacterium]
MRILVCVKQVPDPEAGFEPAAGQAGLLVAGGRYVMNPYDAHAVERALEIKEALPGVEVHALTLGPERCRAVVHRALAMGADRAFHVLCDEDAWIPPAQTARAIARALEGGAYDLVITGALATDDEAACAGPYLAGLLGWETACFVVSAIPAADGKSITVRKEGEGGSLWESLLRLPAVLTAQTTEHSPRWPSLSNMLRANRAEVTVLDFEALETGPETEELEELAEPEERPSGLFLQGTTEEKAREFCRILRERGLL